MMMKKMLMVMNLFCEMINQRKCVKPYFQPGPFSEVITIANLHNISRMTYFIEWNCAIVIVTTTPRGPRFTRCCQNSQDDLLGRQVCLMILTLLNANLTKWSNTLRQFVVNCSRIVWVSLTILSVWHFKN